jgi:hypothetical protein
MRPKSPVVTLLFGVAVAAVAFGVNVAANHSAAAGQRGAGGPAAAATAPSAAQSASAPSEQPTQGGQAAAAPPVANEGTSVEPSKAPSPPITYAGRVDGGEIAIAIAVRDGQGIAYVCNGKKLEAWFQGPAGDGQLALTGKTAGSSIVGTHDGQFAAGTVTLGGRKWTFRIPMVQAPAGLYKIADKVANASIQGGWIVYDGGQTGSVTINGRTDAAPPLNTETGEVVINGVTVKPPRL